MNWQNTLKQAIRQPETTVSNVKPAHAMVAELLDAAKRFAARSDQFAAGKSQTCIDIATKLQKFGSFASDKQAEFAAKLVAWSKPREVAKPAQPTSDNAVPKLFTVMQKHSTFHAGALKITRRNQDTLCWLVWNDQCVGKLEAGQCVLFAKRLGDDLATVRAMIAEFEADPLAAAIKYGKLSGRCCSCGRDLTDPASIEAGIGPICAAKF